MERVVVGVFVAFLLAILGLIVFVAVNDHSFSDFKTNCAAKHGVVRDLSSTVVTYGPKGGVSVGVDSKYLCLSSDGRILDTYGN